MIGKILCASALVFAFICSASCMQPQEPTAEKGGVVDFTLKDLSGTTHTLAEYRGKQPVFLFFWTTWCPFCRKELEVLNDRYQRIVSEGWKVFAIDAGESDAEVSAYLKERPTEITVLLDRDRRVARSLRVLGVPTIILLDAGGSTVHTGHRVPEDLREYLKE